MNEELTHKVRSQEFQITIDNEQDAHHYQSTISLLQQSRIQGLLNRILSEVEDPHSIYQFNTIDLDLGNIPKGNFENELLYRLEEKLLEFFRKNVSESGSLRNGKRIAIGQQKIEQFKHFLDYGYINRDTNSAASPQSLLNDLLKEKRSILYDVLMDKGRNESVRKRLILQFDETLLENVVLLVSREEGKHIVNYKQNILEIQKKEPIVDNSFNSFRNAIWEIILAYLFTESRGFYNKKHFLRFLIKKTASKYHLSYDTLLKSIHLSIQNDQYIGGLATFKTIILELKQEQDKAKPRSTLTPELVKESTKEFILEIDHFLKTGTFRSTTAIVSKSEANQRLLLTLGTNDTLVKKYITKWFTNSAQKAQLLTLLNARGIKALTQFINVPFVIDGFKLFDTLNKVQSSNNSNWIKLFEHRHYIILSAYNGKSQSSKLNLINLLVSISNQFIQKQNSFLTFLVENKSSFPSPVQNAIESFIKTFSPPLHKTQQIQLKKFTNELIDFANSRKIEYWDDWINRQLPTWNKETKLNTSGIINHVLKLIKYDGSQTILKNYLIDRFSFHAIHPKSTLVTSYDLRTKNNRLAKNTILTSLVDFSSNNNKELWRPWIEKQLPKWIKLTNLKTPQILLYLLKLIEKDNSQKELTKYLSKEYKAELGDYKPRSELNTAQSVVFNKALFDELLFKVEEIATKTHLKLNWNSSVILLLTRVAKKYQLTMSNLIRQLIKHTEGKQKKRVTQLLIDLSNSSEFQDLVEIQEKQSDWNVKQEIVLFILEKGTMPWWVSQYSLEQLNNDFPILWRNKRFENKIIKFIKQKSVAPHVVSLFSLSNQVLIWNSSQVGKSLNEVLIAQGDKSALIISFFNLLEKEFLPLNVITEQAINLLKSKLFKLFTSNSQIPASVFLQLLKDWVASIPSLQNQKTLQLLVYPFVSSTITNKTRNQIVALFPIITIPHRVGKRNLVDFINQQTNQLVINKSNESISEQLLSIAKNKPAVIKKLMDQIDFRKQLLVELNPEELSFFLPFYLPPQQQSLFKLANNLLKEEIGLTLDKKIAIQKRFFKLVLLKISLGNLSNWSLKDWGSLLFYIWKQELGKAQIQLIVHSLYEKQIKSPYKKDNSTIEVIEHIQNKINKTQDELTLKRANPDIPATMPKIEKEEKPYKKLGEKTSKELQNPIFIQNGGLILLAPFLGMLFDKCNLIKSDAWLNTECHHKAIHLLHYAAHGNTESKSPEQIINKVLCGIPISNPVDQNITLTDNDKKTVDSLLYNVTQQWTPLKGTSIDGLRSSFIQREAKFEEEEEQYYMVVEKQSFDMLLDKIPWNIGKIKLSWMLKLLEVQWRT